jgi:hypothetical protein
MSRALVLVDGIPRMRGVYATAPTIYDDSLVVGAGGIETGTPIELPSGQLYQGSELEVYLNGSAMEYGNDYQYVGTGSKSQIEMTFDLTEGDQLRFRIDTPTDDAMFVYDQSVVIGAGGMSNGVALSLPNSRVYSGDELQVYVNGQSMEHLVDYLYVGASEFKSQVSFTFDLAEGERVRFRIEP